MQYTVLPPQAPLPTAAPNMPAQMTRAGLVDAPTSLFPPTLLVDAPGVRMEAVPALRKGAVVTGDFVSETTHKTTPLPWLNPALVVDQPGAVFEQAVPALREGAVVTGDFVPETTYKTTALPWLNPALVVDQPGAVCDGEWPVAKGDYCAQVQWSFVHLKRRVALVLMVGAWWLLLSAGAGGGRQ